jgi:tetratricopeptide (TPR) repeat protein
MLPVPSATEWRAQEELVRWRQLWEQGVHGALLNEVGARLKEGTLPAEGYGLAALACLGLQRYEEAVRAAQNGVARAPREAWLYGVLAEALIATTHWERAIVAADQAARLAPEEPAWAALGARCRRLAGHLKEALELAERALRRHPSSVLLLVERGCARAETDPAAALEDFRQAQGLAPADPAPWLAEGDLQARVGNWEGARRAYGQALRRATAPGVVEAAEDGLVKARAVGAPLLRLLLLTARITVIGWCVILFAYYLFFRFLQIGWRIAPAFRPVGQSLLLITAVGGGVLVLAGHGFRWMMRRRWAS